MRAPASAVARPVGSPASRSIFSLTRQTDGAICDGRWVDLIPAGLLGILGFLSIAYLTLFSNTAPGDGLRAVVFPPWMTEAEMLSHIVAAEALPVRSSQLGFVIFVKPEGTAFAERVRALGAWAVANPLGYAACGTGSLS